MHNLQLAVHSTRGPKYAICLRMGSLHTYYFLQTILWVEVHAMLLLCPACGCRPVPIFCKLLQSFPILYTALECATNQ